MGKQQAIRESIGRAIAAGEHPPGSRLPAEVELCRRFGAARATVAAALRGLRDAGLISRQRGSGTFVTRRGESAGDTRVGLLISGIGDTEIFEPICSSIATDASRLGFRLLWNQLPPCAPAEKAAAALAVCRQYIREKVDGIFFEPLELTDNKDGANAAIVRLLRDAGMAVVLIDSDLSYPERSALDLAGVDNFRAGHALAGHLLGLGCRSPVFVHRPRSATTTHARADGFRAALAAHGISPAGRVLEAEPDDARLAKKLLSGLRADGIVCGNDYTAALLMKNLLAAGARIPGRVKITGVDDLKYARLLGIPLTTLAQPCREIGLAALELMRFRLENPAAPARQILPDFKIIIRESTVKNAGDRLPSAQPRH